MQDFPGGSDIKQSTCHYRRYRRCLFNPWVRKIPWRRKWQPTPELFPGKSNGQSAWQATKSQIWLTHSHLILIRSACVLSHVWLFVTPRKPAILLCPQHFSGKNTGVGCHFLLQEIFLTQKLNLCLLHWQEDSLPLQYLGSNVDNSLLIITKKTGKGQFSFQSQRKAMPKNAQTTTQLHSSHMLAK